MRFVWSTCFLMLLVSAPLAWTQGLPNGTNSEPKAIPETPPPLVAEANGGKHDWNRVRQLAHDEEINVWASNSRHVRCLFTGATEDFLFCEPVYRSWDRAGGEYRFNRVDVDKVRLEQSERNFKATAATMALAGVIGGALATNTKYGGMRAAGGLAGGLAGMIAGTIVGGPIAIFVPGHLVYERPRMGSRSPASSGPVSSHTSQKGFPTADVGTTKEIAIQ
jgi:hypothetical protein